MVSKNSSTGGGRWAPPLTAARSRPPVTCLMAGKISPSARRWKAAVRAFTARALRTELWCEPKSGSLPARRFEARRWVRDRLRRLRARRFFRGGERFTSVMMPW